MALSQSAQAVIYMRIAAVSIGLYDYVMTLSSEQRMWKRQMGRHRPRVIFILYLLCRYVGVIALIIPTASFFGHVSAAACPKFVAAGGSLRILLSECAALVLLWRTWAIWSMSRAILTFMSTLLVPVTIVSVMSITKQKSFMYAGHCTAVVSSHGIIGRKWVFSLVHLVYDTIAFLLSSWRLMMNVRLGASPISSALLRDGMIYYFCIVSAHILNLFWFTRTVPEQQNMTQLFSVALTMIFSQRIITSVNERVFDAPEMAETLTRSQHIIARINPDLQSADFQEAHISIRPLPHGVNSDLEAGVRVTKANVVKLQGNNPDEEIFESRLDIEGCSSETEE